MGALMRSFDWDNHPLGNPSRWPVSLKANIRLLLNSGFPMFIWWSKDFYMFHNDAYLPALGNKHPEALGASARVIWSEIWENIGGMADSILAGGNPVYIEALPLFLKRKGFLEETHWTFSYSPAFNDHGGVEGVFCAAKEVTSRVLNERRLRSLKDVSEKVTQMHTLEQVGQRTCEILLQNKQDVPLSMIYLLNNTGTAANLMGKAGDTAVNSIPTFLDISENVTCTFLKDLLTSRQMSLLPFSDLASRLNLEDVLKDGVEQVAVLPIMRSGSDQTIGIFVAGISPNLEYDTNYSGFHALLASQIGASITSVQVRQELVQQQKYLKEIFQQAPVGIAITRGPEYVIDLANPAVCEIWGRRPEDVLGISVKESMPEIVEQGFIQLLDNVVSTGVPFLANELPVELERNGQIETLFLNFIYHPMRDTTGAVSGVIAIAIDVSEQVKYRQSVESLNQELLATNADLDNFVYSASHDLKAPISNIEGLMGALIESLPEESIQTEVTQHILSLIQTSIDRFKRAVTDLTEVTKIQREAGDDVNDIHLSEVVKEVELDFKTLIADTGAQVTTDLDPDAIIHFSAKNVRSVVYNLMSNALKYRSPDRSPRIEVTTEKKSDHVVLKVKDNGLGLKLTDKEKIFAMFKRMHDHVEGSGIGLYIVKRIVENAGGSIDLESEEGVGSTFKIYFKS